MPSTRVYQALRTSRRTHARKNCFLSTCTHVSVLITTGRGHACSDLSLSHNSNSANDIHVRLTRKRVLVVISACLGVKMLVVVWIVDDHAHARRCAMPGDTLAHREGDPCVSIKEEQLLRTKSRVKVVRAQRRFQLISVRGADIKQKGFKICIIWRKERSQGHDRRSIQYVYEVHAFPEGGEFPIELEIRQASRTLHAMLDANGSRTQLAVQNSHNMTDIEGESGLSRRIALCLYSNDLYFAASTLSVSSRFCLFVGYLLFMRC